MVRELFNNTCTGSKVVGPIKTVKGPQNGKWGVTFGDVGLLHKIKYLQIICMKIHKIKMQPSASELVSLPCLTMHILQDFCYTPEVLRVQTLYSPLLLKF